jgi:AMP nucleosidase
VYLSTTSPRTRKTTATGSTLSWIAKSHKPKVGTSKWNKLHGPSVFTTNRRVWEHDSEFKKYLQKVRAMAIDMETATIFLVGFYNKIPTGALLLVSDQPMIPDGVKTDKSDVLVTSQFVDNHIKIGIDALNELINNGLTVKHLRWD